MATKSLRVTGWRRWAGNAVFLILALPLAGGVWALAKLQWEGHWPVPEFLLSRLHQELGENRLRLDYQEVAYLPPARIIVSDGSLHSHLYDETILAADTMEIRLQARALARGRIQLEGVSLLDGSVRCPASLSPTGRTEEPVRGISLSVEKDDAGWRVDRAAFAMGTMRVMAIGPLPEVPRIVDTLPVPVDPPDPPEPKPAEDWEERFARLIRLLTDAEALLEPLDYPVVEARSFFEDNGDWILKANAGAELMRLPFAASVTAPRGEIHLRLAGEEWHVEQAVLQASEAAAISHGYTGVARGAELSAQWAGPLRVGHFHPVEVESRVSVLEVAGVPLEGVRLFARDTGEQWFDFSLRAGLDGGFLEIGGKVEPWQGRAQAEAVGWLNPTPVMVHPLLKELGFDKEVVFENPVSAFARGRIGPNWQNPEATGIGTTRHALIHGVAMDSAQARIKVDLERFTVPEMTLRHGDFETLGSYDVVYADRSYRFLFDGTVRPGHLNPWFGNWWTLLWEDIRLAGDPLHGDIDIMGNWRDREEIRLFGKLRAENLLVRDHGFTETDLFLRVNGMHTRVDLVPAKRPEGEVRGRIDVWADRGPDGWNAVEVDLASTAAVEDLADMFGNEGRNLVETFSFHQPPSLHLKGRMKAPAAGGSHDFELKGKSLGPIAFNGMELEDLEVEARILPDSTRLNQIRGRLGGGEAEGTALLAREPGGDRLHFDLSLKEADLASVAMAWQTLSNRDNNRQIPDLDGRLNLSLEASGDYGDTRSFTGGGDFHLREADLADVHLLGLLSRLLGGIPMLGFTSLHFDEAISRFEVRGDTIHFPDLKMIGPAATIRAKGDYAIEDSGLEFAAKVYLIQQDRIPLLSLILTPITAPLANVLEVKLQGTLDDPQWRFLYGPRGVMETLQTSATP